MRGVISRVLERPLAYRYWTHGLDARKREMLARLMRGTTARRVLDVGCGTGENSRLFPDAAYVGLDLNEAYVRMASRRFPERRFLLGDATRPLPCRGRDLILISSLLHHLDDSAALAVLRHAAQALAAGGQVVTLEPEIPPRGARVPSLLMYLDRGDHFRSASAWVELFECAGFRVVSQLREPLALCGLTAWYLCGAALEPRGHVG